jgi:hypothetical protein
LTDSLVHGALSKELRIRTKKDVKEGGRSEMKGRREGNEELGDGEKLVSSRKGNILRAPVGSVSQLVQEDASQPTPPPSGICLTLFYFSHRVYIPTQAIKPNKIPREEDCEKTYITLQKVNGSLKI